MNNFHEQGEELAGAYVLDALSSEENDAFEAHLGSCASCRHEVAELRQVVGVLPLAVELVEPPSDLRTRILAEARNDPAHPSLTTLAGGQATQRRRVADRLRTPSAALLALAAVLVAALGLWNLNLEQQVNHQPGTALQPAVIKALAAGARVSPVSATSSGQATSASMVQPRNGPGYLVVQGLPTAPSHRVYQLWLIKQNHTVVSAGTFTGSGTNAQVWPLKASARGFSRTAVTVEPGPQGSTHPTGAPILIGDLPA